MNTSCTLWMGDLEIWMNEEYLIKMFKDLSKFFNKSTEVNVVSVKVVKDNTDSKKYGILLIISFKVIHLSNLIQIKSP